MRHSLLTPVSMRLIKANEFDWEVSQEFLRLAKYPVTIYARGSTRIKAIQNFERQLKYAEDYREWDLIGDWCGWLYDVAGWIDSVSRKLKP